MKDGLNNRPHSAGKLRPWLASPALRFAAAVYVAAVAGYYSPWGRHFERFVGYRADFVARHALKRGPVLDPHLKVFWNDDLTVADRHSVDLSSGEWTQLLTAVQAAHPRRIFIDKTFAFLAKDNDLAALRASFAGGAPVVTLADGRDAVLAGRPQLPEGRAEMALRTYNPALPDGVFDDEGFRTLPWMRHRRPYFYGADERLLPAIAQVGEAMVNEDGTVLPLIAGPNGLVLPHAGLYGGAGLSLTESGLVSGGVDVPLTRFGDLLPNMLGPWSYEPVRKSMIGLMRAAKDNVTAHGIDAGDTVVILPAMYTGNVDIKDTPLGDMPGGLLLVSVINSAMTGQWLQPMRLAPLLFLAAAGIGCALVEALSASLSVIFLMLTAVAMVGVGLACFVLGGLVVPWDLAVLTLAVSGTSALAFKMRASERRNFWLDTVLRGVVPPIRLAEILADPTSLRLEPSEQVVTIVFIDIVGFSSTADNQTPRQAFLDLRKIIQGVVATVHRYNGVVDRTLGDGLLCYFGCDYSGRTTDQNHAEQAVRCAIEVQVENMNLAIDRAGTGEPVYPLRIGVNTAGVFLGDLGDERRIDFTLIGNGVNFAQRLESSCEPNLILVGSTTRTLLGAQLVAPEAVLKKLVKIKHHDDLVEAFEVRPPDETKQLFDKATSAYWQFKQVHRRDHRVHLKECLVRSVSRFGAVDLVDYSVNGLGLLLPVYLARGVEFVMQLESPDRGVQAILESGHLSQVTVEVRWAKKSGLGYFHGVLVKGLNPTQTPMLAKALQEGVRSPVAS